METRTVTLNPGESREVAFTVTPDIAKSYTVSVDGLYGTFSAIEAPKAEFVVSELIISPSTVYVGEPVTISVMVTNVGNATGTKTIVLEVI